MHLGPHTKYQGNKGGLWTEKFKSPELEYRSLGKFNLNSVLSCNTFLLFHYSFMPSMGRGIPNTLALCYSLTASWAISCSVLLLPPRRVKNGGSGRQMSFPLDTYLVRNISQAAPGSDPTASNNQHTFQWKFGICLKKHRGKVHCLTWCGVLLS